MVFITSGKQQLENRSIEERSQNFGAPFEFPSEDRLRLEQFAPHSDVL